MSSPTARFTDDVYKEEVSCCSNKVEQTESLTDKGIDPAISSFERVVSVLMRMKQNHGIKTDVGFLDSQVHGDGK